jgi:hypothetical protein
MIDNAARGGAVEGGGVARIEASDDDMLWFESCGVNGDVVAAVSAPAGFMGVRIIDELLSPTCCSLPAAVAGIAGRVLRCGVTGTPALVALEIRVTAGDVGADAGVVITDSGGDIFLEVFDMYESYGGKGTRLWGTLEGTWRSWFADKQPS